MGGTGFPHKRKAGRTEKNYDQCVREYYLEGDRAIISCRVRGMEDIVSPYSVAGRENMSAELAAYLEDNIFYVPLRYPIVVRFVGASFTEEEQAVIRRTLLSAYEFRLALARQNRVRNRFYSLLTLGLGFMFLILYFILGNSGVLGMTISILFWFFLWEFGMSGWTKMLSLRDEIHYAARVVEAEIQFAP